MHWPQIALIGILACSLGLHLSRHGEPRQDKYNAGNCLIGQGILVWLLWCGGFFG